MNKLVMLRRTPKHLVFAVDFGFAVGCDAEQRKLRVAGDPGAAARKEPFFPSYPGFREPAIVTLRCRTRSTPRLLSSVPTALCCRRGRDVSRPMSHCGSKLLSTTTSYRPLATGLRRDSQNQPQDPSAKIKPQDPSTPLRTGQKQPQGSFAGVVRMRRSPQLRMTKLE